MRKERDTGTGLRTKGTGLRTFARRPVPYSRVFFFCPICFQADASPTTDGVQAAVLVLLGVTATVLTGFGIFIAKFLRRS